jgi:hypothetical protein
LFIEDFADYDLKKIDLHSNLARNGIIPLKTVWTRRTIEIRVDYYGNWKISNKMQKHTHLK